MEARIFNVIKRIPLGNNQQKIKTGDIVLIHDERPRIDWRLAVIEDLIPGGDGLIRAASIRTSTGKTTRPITKLYPLEVNTNLHTNTTADTTDDPNPTDGTSDTPSRKGRSRVTEWSKILCAPPPEDVEMN